MQPGPATSPSAARRRGAAAAEARYRGLVEQSLLGVYILQNDRLVYVNPKGATSLGYTRRSCSTCRRRSRFVHEQDRPW